MYSLGGTSVGSYNTYFNYILSRSTKAQYFLPEDPILRVLPQQD